MRACTALSNQGFEVIAVACIQLVILKDKAKHVFTKEFSPAKETDAQFEVPTRNVVTFTQKMVAFE